MEFFLLIVINIILGTFFYLIIRLKLEKSTTSYMETRLRREMNDIIREFNATAERNISILENRIALMKRALVETEGLKSIDINIGTFKDENDFIEKQSSIVSLKSSIKDSGQRDNYNKSYEIPRGDLIQTHQKSIRQRKNILILKEELNGFSEKFMYILKYCRKIFINTYKNKIRGFSLNKDFYKVDKLDINNGNDRIDKIYENVDADSNIPIDETIVKNDSNIQKKLIIESDIIDGTDMNEDEISSLFLTSNDIYSLISKLHNKGYSINYLSRCSGIPIGEVKLVLDLDNSI